MKKFTLLLILIGLTILLILVLFVAAVSATTYKVDVDQDYGFYRVVSTDKNQSVSYINKTLNIAVGDTVVWVNDATPDWPLTIVSNQGLWRDGDAIKKAIPKAFSKEDVDRIEDVGLHPLRINPLNINRCIN